MPQWLKKRVEGTSLDFFARSVHARLFRDQYDKQTVSVMKRALNKRSNCIDVGCHRGMILRHITRIASRGCHYAFEPIPELYQYLLDHFPNVSVYDYALSDTKGEKTFQYMMSDPPLSGFKKITPKELSREIRVKTNLLDNVIPDSIQIDFIKIDVEGAEFQVLNGSKKIVTRNKPIIVFEHNLNSLNHYDIASETIYGFLVDQCGMRISLMERWLKSDPPLRQEEFSEQTRKGINGYFIAYP